ncbi:hypothetical protein FWJ25_04130 [Marinobacter salinexigens]|uniref:LPS-assembly lipoprotein LptE n=1 Tax=Marinobacter salinexigens TaxID=2919747 RepID=A0A5B0VP17_9GAMM|nr:LPS assembly lipoprotein LptE [Marinobacter salinexigens]KAA1176327.1 hypothetical protein FWJ25_04130 [Marinobacter salinexigens]
MPLMKAVISPLVVTLLVALQAGCGFQLRGAPPVSDALQPLAVDCGSQIPDSLCRTLKEQLRLGEVALSDDGSARYRLKLSSFEQDRRASAITSQAAAAEYTLRHSVDLEVVSDDNIPMVSKTRLTTSESYRYDETNVLAKQREEDALRQQLSDRLAQQIIFRLAPLSEARINAIREDYNSASNNAATP